jgi:hypothetical protein
MRKEKMQGRHGTDQKRKRKNKRDTIRKKKEENKRPQREEIGQDGADRKERTRLQSPQMGL